LPSRSAADPGAEAQKAGRTGTQQAFPSGIQNGDDGQEHIPEVGQRRIDFIRHVQPFRAAVRVSATPRPIWAAIASTISRRRSFVRSAIAPSHQRGNAIAVIEHAFAHDFGGMGGQYRHDQCRGQQRRSL